MFLYLQHVPNFCPYILLNIRNKPTQGYFCLVNSSSVYNTGGLLLRWTNGWRRKTQLYEKYILWVYLKNHLVHKEIHLIMGWFSGARGKILFRFNSFETWSMFKLCVGYSHPKPKATYKAGRNGRSTISTQQHLLLKKHLSMNFGPKAEKFTCRKWEWKWKLRKAIPLR